MNSKRRTLWSRMFAANAQAPGPLAATLVEAAAPAGLASSMRPLALEQRFMFDGAAAVDVAHAAIDAGAHAADAQGDAPLHALMAEVATAAAAPAPRNEVIFIDSGVRDAAQLLASALPGTEVVLLDTSRDGLQQMAEYLQGRSGLDAIHIISHGAEGQVRLGAASLDPSNLAAYAAELSAIGAGLTADGDILLYGCNIGADAQGQGFLAALAGATGADVAASSNATGAQALGGDWVLERQSGSIEADLPFDAGRLAGYDAVLVSPVNGVTDFGPGVADYALVSGPGNVGMTALNVGGTGWDISVKTQTDAIIGLGLGGNYIEQFYGRGNTVYYTLTEGSGSVALESFKVASNSGHLFDLQGMLLYIETDGSHLGTNLTVTGYRNGVAVAGATEDIPFESQWDMPTIDVSHNNKFLGIDSFTITKSGGSNVELLLIDDIHVLNVRAPVAAPVIHNLNGDSVNYYEDSSLVLLDAAGNAVVTDADSANFNGGKLTVRVTAGGTPAEDVLFIRNQGAGANQVVLSGSTVMFNGLAIGTFTGGSNGNPLEIALAANATPANVTALLRNLAYRNSNTIEPSTTARNVSITLEDGSGGTSAASLVTVNVTSVNDAPVVNASGVNPTYTENGSAVQLFTGTTINTVEGGQRVNGLTFTVTGVANGDAEKLVIDGRDVALANGTSVTTGSGVSVSVLVTSGTATITLTHSGMATSMAQALVNTMAYRNDSESPNTANRVVTLNTLRDSGGTANGGLDTAALGISSTVSVVGVNDAPVLAGGSYSFPTINEDTTSTGVQVSTMLAGYTLIDSDAGALRGIAVIGKTGSGIWQYSTDNSAWTDFGSVSGTSALLLSATTYVRYVPNGANGETATLTIRGWDQTAGTASANGIRGLADTSSNGGSTAFSTGTAVASVVVTSVNDAPVMTPVSPTLSPLNDTSTANPGDLVSSLTGGITDVDSGALKGIAVTGLTSTYGKWQFTTNAGASWNDMGVVSNSAALMLRPSDRIRFVPDGIHGETATITYKAWDQTGGTGGFQGAKVNTSTSGGTLPYSSATDTASVTVTAVNDAPVVTGSAGPASWTEGNNVASTPVVVDPALTVSDTDGPNPNQATARMLTYYGSQDTLAFVNDSATMGNIIGSWNAGTGILTLTSAGNQASLAQFQAALRAVTYANSSESPNATTRTVQFIVTDGGGLSSNAVTRDIAINAVNDAPTIGAPASMQVNEDVPTALSGISFSDADSTLGIVTLSVGSGTLGATTAGGVTVGGTSTALTLSGTLANINQFVANNRLIYTPAVNASGDVTLTINVNTTSVSDATTTMNLQVVAVNDAPVVTVPSDITVTEDVASVISGISFSDVDAGAHVVTATFSVPSGTLQADSGGGVTVGGSGTGALTLTGRLADINSFVAASNLSFKTAANATWSVTLTVSINDGGNTGTGGARSDTKTVALNVAAVNDAPVNTVPGTQSVPQNGSLMFYLGNDNRISISDVDAGTGPDAIEVTLSATNGTLTLPMTLGLTMLVGDGKDDQTMSFRGRLSQINIVLQGLVFKPTEGFIGSASLTIETNDRGLSGSGGAKTDSDTIAINVIPVNPKITGVSAQGPDRNVKIGDEVLVDVVFDQIVKVDLTGGSPTLLLETGQVDRSAVYQGGAGTNTLTFKYTVQSGDLSADLDFHSTVALQLNGALLSNATNDLAILTLPTVGGANSLGGRSNIVVDGVAPVVTSVGAPADRTYIAGQNLDFSVNFSEAVTVDSTGGTPRIAVTLDTGGTVYASYVSGSGSSALVFRMTAASGQRDANGVALGSSLQLNGGRITDGAGNDVRTTLNNVASTANVNIDAVAPVVASVNAPPDGSYRAGDALNFTVNASEALQTGALAPRLALDVGGTPRYATYVSGSGTDKLVFRYVVQAGDNDADGIAIGGLDVRGEQLTDLAGNDLDLTLNGVESLQGVRIDTTAPVASGIVRIDPSPTNAGSVSFTVTFSENVAGVDAGDFQLVSSGTASGSIASVTAVDGKTYTVVVGSLSGAGTLGLNLRPGGAGIVDAAGNAIGGGLAGEHYTLDRVAPQVTSVAVPASGTYVAGQNLDFTVNMSETVTVDTTGGTPRIAITLDNGATAHASYVSGSGSAALVFRMTVASGQLDADGLRLGAGLELNGGALRDAVGNDVVLTLNGVASTLGVRIDAVAPGATITLNDTALRAGETATATIAFDEAVLGLDLADFDVGAGALSNLATADGGKTWTATFTPGTDIEQAQNAITLRSGAVTDAAGNANGIALSGNYAVDTRLPMASIVVADSALSAGETSLVTIAFSEAVTGLELPDFEVQGGALSALSSSDGGLTWTATFTPAADVEQFGAVITLKAQAVADAAGNAIGGASVSNRYAVDTLRPTAGIVVADAALSRGQSTQATITFNEAVRNFTISDLLAPNVALSNLQSTDSGKTWTVTLTANDDVEDATNLLALNNAGVNDAAGNAGTGLSQSGNYAVDTLRPTASIVVADGALAAGESALVTITFSEAVSGFSNDDLFFANGSLSPVVSSDGGVTWTATFTPSADIASTSNLITLHKAGVSDLAGNAGTGTTGSNYFAIDTQRPTASITVANTALQAGAGSLVTIAFSEAVSGLELADFEVANGTLSGLASSDGGVTWTATFTPGADVEQAVNAITLRSGTVNDGAGNANAGAAVSNGFAIDTRLPTATITVADTALQAGETSLVTIAFNEAVNGLQLSDFDVSHGALSGLASKDGGKTWTATFTPGANVEQAANAITLRGGAVRDAAGNASAVATISNGFAIDTRLPTATITVADTALRLGQSSLVTIAFSEAVEGLEVADFEVSNGVLSDLSTRDGGLTWTAKLAPGFDVQQGANVIGLRSAAVTDAAGNANSGAVVSNSYAVDTRLPTARITLADTALQAGETTLVSIVFSEAVRGLDTADLRVPGGTLSELRTNDGITWTATLTPHAGVQLGALRIELDNAGYTDLAGNSSVGLTPSEPFAIDTQRPTATITVSDASLQAGETAQAGISFSEVVQGLDLADFSVENGTLSDLRTDDGLHWTATLTPHAAVPAGASQISLNNAGYTDLAGNTGVGWTQSERFAVDTQRPTATITVADTALQAGETSQVTIAFSEAVQGLDLSDFSVANGTLSDLRTQDGILWTATLTPNDGVQALANQISLTNAGYTDLAGNSGAGSTRSEGFAIDTQRPTASISVDDSALQAGETARVRIVFSEAVQGLDLADFSVPNGVLSDLRTLDGITWTATLTPNDEVQAGADRISLDNAGYTDLAGNAGVGSTQSESLAIDTQRPSATITVDATELLAGQTARVTIVFSEAVQGLDVADFSVANGALSDLSTLDGITWTATLTPANDVQADGNLIRLDNAGYADLAGNAGVGETGSDGYAVATAPVPVQVLAAAPIVVPAMPGLGSAVLTPVQGEGGASDFGFLSPGNGSSGLNMLSSPLALALAGFSELPPAARETDGPAAAQDVAAAPYVPQTIPRTSAGSDGLQLLRSVNDLSIGSNGQLSWQVPANLFGHTDPLAVVSLSMTLANGAPLPQWIRFDARTGTLQVQAPDGLRGELVLQLTARDDQGREVKTTVKLKPGAQAAARAGVAEQFQRAALQRAGGTAAQRLHA